MQKKSGAIYLVLLLVMSGVFIFLATAIMGLAFANLRLARHNESMVSSLSIAEAGVNYYLWHLSHAPTDFCDGHTPCVGNAPSGPYMHEFTGPNGTVLGNFTLTITPPATGGTIYDIKSVGTAKDATVSRTVRAGIGIQSFAAYALVSNSFFWVGENEATDGPVHSNDRMQYDYANANDIISSSVENGVFTPLSGVDQSKWQFPPQYSVPKIDFTKISSDLTGQNGIRAASLTTKGINLPALNGNNKGYYLKLKTDNTIDKAVVTAENGSGITKGATTNLSLPTDFNGILYSEMPIWIEGTWNNKLTLATAATYTVNGNKTSITIVGNLKYVSKDGTNKIGLVGKGDIRVPRYEPANDMEINAVMASQEGSVQYPLTSPAEAVVKNSITVYGSISSFKRWNWTWINASNIVTQGFRNTYQIYDRHLTIDPPPMFPTTGDYQVLTWREE